MKRNIRIKKEYITVVTAIAVLVMAVLYFVDVVTAPKDKMIDGECEFHFVDVGQGDCAMIICDESVVVVDTGPQDHAKETEEYIKSYTDTIDYLILTHPHEDHIGGADELLESVDVKNVIMSDAATETVTFERLLDSIEKSGANVIEAIAGDSYRAGEIEITILSPVSDFTNLNDYSIVTRIEYKDTAAIITGDVEHHSEKLIVEEYSPSMLRANIFEVSHHGSNTSNHDKFLDAVSPDYAVIQCEEGNSYGHPHVEVIEKLEERHVQYYRTDKGGHVVFVSDGYDVEKKD